MLHLVMHMCALHMYTCLHTCVPMWMSSQKYHLITSVPFLTLFQGSQRSILMWPTEQCAVWSCFLLRLFPDAIPSHLLHSYQLPGSLETSPGILFSCRSVLCMPTHPPHCIQHPCSGEEASLEVGTASQTGSGGAILSHGSVGFLPSPDHCLSQYIHRVINLGSIVWLIV